MRSAETVLGVIRERGRRGLPLERVYRQLFNRDLYLLAYGRIARNHGALTPGATAETADGMSLAKIDAIIEALRFERYPVDAGAADVHPERPTGNGGRSGIPTWSDKLLQEVLRLILEAYYEPQFSDRSHGFRPGRGCHTALTEIYRRWKGTTWFIEGDISACFDSIDHDGPAGDPARDDPRRPLPAADRGPAQGGLPGGLAFNATLSGTPQGGVVSPILANIYLDRLDTFVETTLLPAYNRGARAERQPGVHARSTTRPARPGATGTGSPHAALRRQMQRLPSVDPADPGYRRLRYVRYADDLLLGFVGPRHEAEAIKRQLGEFLRDHPQAGALRGQDADHPRADRAPRGSSATRSRSSTTTASTTTPAAGRINGVIGLKVPLDVVRHRVHALPAPRQAHAPLRAAPRLRLQHRRPVPAGVPWPRGVLPAGLQPPPVQPPAAGSWSGR